MKLLANSIITGSGAYNQVFIDNEYLSPKASQWVQNHSPDGFNWSYGGSGAAQLALGLLILFTCEYSANKLYQEFKWEVIAKLPKGNFKLEAKSVAEWVKQKGALLHEHLRETY